MSASLITELGDLSKEELLEVLPYLEPKERQALITYIREDALWHSLPGSPQEIAYSHPADRLLFGGRAGGGKTDLALGLAATAHIRTLFLRREFGHQKENIDRAREIIGSYNGSKYNSQTHIYTIYDSKRKKRLLEFGGCKDEKDKEDYKGRPRDLYIFDELPDFTRTQFEFIIGWNRTTITGQRCRILCTGNPPNTAEGEWVLDYWGAWLNPNHRNPAKPGELRWYVRLPGMKAEEIEVDPEELRRDALGYWRWRYKNTDPREDLYAHSRSFIPATLDDNPYLSDSAYRVTLDGLPEPLRSRLKLGDFSVGRSDDPTQVIPTEWVELAFDRYRKGKRPDVPLTQIGVDPSRGGEDATTVARRYSNWIEEVLSYPGSEIKKGQDVVDKITPLFIDEPVQKDEIVIAIDMTGGWGSSPYDLLVGEDYNVVAIVFSETTYERSRNGLLAFKNVRAAMHWNAREALDPEHGDDVALYPDPEVKADLTAPKWRLTTAGIQVEEKKEIKERIGRSPDKGEAVMLSMYLGKYLAPEDEDSPLAKALRSRGR